MISLTLTNVKNFMSHLLLKETFDNFSFIEGEIITFNTFRIDGYIQKDFFDSEEEIPEYSLWKNLREFCFSLIKGKKTPLGFHFVFSLNSKNISRLIEQKELGLNPADVQGLYLNMSVHRKYLRAVGMLPYSADSAPVLLTCVTGTSFKSFMMDKTLEREWDEMVKKFFLKKEIAFELM